MGKWKRRDRGDGVAHAVAAVVKQVSSGSGSSSPCSLFAQDGIRARVNGVRQLSFPPPYRQHRDPPCECGLGGIKRVNCGGVSVHGCRSFEYVE